MFDRNAAQGQPMGDTGNVSLPGSNGFTAPAQAAPAHETPNTEHSDNQDLAALKQQALAQLSPLVSHLDQAPEEKFRTTMMMIQASDDQKLIPKAYEAAQAITDEKAKAQALLDVINEINYFSQRQDSAS